MKKGAVDRIVLWAIALSMILQPIPFGLLNRSPNPVDARSSTATSLSTTADLAPAAQVDGVTVPDVLAHPISVSRVQSQYTGGSAVVITYTVTNNQLPVAYPIVPPEASIEETLALTADFEPTADPNTLQDVLLTTELTANATVVTAEPAQHQSGASLAWTLDDIAPGQSTKVVLTVSGVGSASAFTDLDAGATAWGTLQGRAVSAQTAPARLAPEDLSRWLIWTVDADLHNDAMLARAAKLRQDPAALFAFVRDLTYEAYSGSLRGTAGTLWSGAGNSVDQSSLLIAMLRASGIPARYRHGTLATGDAQTLIAGMFPTPTQFAGYVPPEATVADPVNDAGLIAEATDHWWVEAYLPGEGWVDLDPAFVDASIGQAFAAPAGDGSDRIAKLPDTLRHKVRMGLKVEDYHPLNLGNGGLDYSYPLDVTFNTVEIATQPVAFSHLVESQGQSGLVYTNIIHTYTPYLLIGEETILGDAYQDIFTNFPLGTVFHTAIWLTFEMQHPDGSSESYEREIADRIGAAARLAGGEVPLNLEVSSDSPPLVTAFDIYTTGFWPNLVPPQTLAQSRAATLASLPALNADAQRLQALDTAASLTPGEEAELREIRARFQKGMARYLGDIGVMFAEAADRLLVDTQAGVFVRAYYDAPRVVIVGVEPGDGTTPTFTLDLRDTTVRTLPYPGQAEHAAFGFNMVKGIVESGLEGAALATALGQSPLTTAHVFEAATEQGIATTIVTAGNLAWLESLAISDEAKARITAAALDGKILIVPETPVTVAGETHIGWWQVDSVSGETVGVMENGLHLAALEYLFGLGAGSIVGGPMTDFILGFTSYTLGFVADRVDKAIGENTFDLDAYLKSVANTATAATCLSGLSSIIFSFDVWAAGNCGAGLAGAATGSTTDFFGLGQDTAKNYLASVVQYDPPVPQNWQAVAPPDASQARASAAVSVAAATGASNLDIDVTTGSTTVFGAVVGSWSTDAQQTFPVSGLSASGTLRDDPETVVGSGAVAAGPLSGATFTLSGSPTDVSLAGEGHVSFYAPALTDLASGAHWAAFNADLDGADALTLQATEAVLNGVTRTGDFVLEATTPVAITGQGGGAAPNYAPEVALQATGAQIRLGPASGIATADGTPLDVGNGLAVARYDGVVTVAEQGATTDQVKLQDGVDFFTLDLTPAGSTVTPQAPATFQTAVYANFTDAYTVTATAPTGWDVTVSASGAVTAQPPVGAAAGDYAIQVTVQSTRYPNLILSAIHTVAIGSFDDFSLDVTPDATFTVPMGPVRDPNAVSGSTNTGQAQIPGAAYVITLINQANEARTYDVSVSGLAAGWARLSQDGGITSASLKLPAGARGTLGLYIDPDKDARPVPGEAFDFTVTAQSDSGLSDSVSLTFTMPAVPFSYVTVDPPMHYLERNTQATVELGVTNVGNAAGTFPLAVRSAAPTIELSGAPASPVSLAPGETITQQVTLAIGEAPLNQMFPIWFSSPAPDGVYTQTQATHVWVTTSPVNEILAAAQCDAGSTSYRDAVYSLAIAVGELQRWCAQGDCPPPLLDQVVSAATAVAAHARIAVAPTAIPTLGDLEAAIDDLAAQTQSDAILDAVDGVSAALSTVGNELCQIGAHQVSVRLSPTLQASRPGESVTFDLTVTNRGTLTTTTAVTVSGLPSGDLVTGETIPPEGRTDIPISISPTELGIMELTAEAAPVVPESTLDLRRTAAARLKVVDRFIQVTAVRADPAFVEAGVSSTTLQAEVANIAGIGQKATATATALAPDGTEQWQGTTDLRILGGAPRTYDLASVDTSGWIAGIYTLTVDVQLATPITESSSGYGYLSVGQAVAAGHAVFPELFAPGTVTVTTTITAALSDPNALEDAALEADKSETELATLYTASASNLATTDDTEVVGNSEIGAEDPNGDSALIGDGEVLQQSSEPVSETETQMRTVEETATPLTFSHAELPTPSLSTLQNQSSASEPLSSSTSSVEPLELTVGGFTRTEQDNPAITYTGTWSNHTSSRASGGSYWRNATAGSTAAFTFEGEWLNVGSMGSRWGGYVELAIDGESRGTFDLYRREDNTPISLIFDELGTGPHTLTITVVGSSNPFASGTRVELDYIDVHDGSPLGDGTFEENDVRVLRSTGWVTVTDTNARGGSYSRGGSVTAWFPFDGDSFTYHALAYNSANRVQLYVDGQHLDTVDLHHPNHIGSAITRTFSYTGFGPGPHLLQISSYRSQTTLDAITTPGEAPFIDPEPPVTGITRYEEDHPAIRYNGAPYTQTAQSWNRADSIDSTRASDGQYLYSAAAGDTISFEFEGPWIGVGFATDRLGGQAEIAIDGTLMTEVDLYTREGDTESFYFDNLGAGSHTITITVLGTRHPNALNSRTYLDYLDVWDGLPLAEGTFEETNGRIFYSNGWSRLANAGASDGGLAATGTNNGTAWFPFTGDSITVQAWTTGDYHSLELKIDGVSLGHFNTYRSEAEPRAFSFEDLGDGPHVLEVRKYRNSAAVDAFITPATGEHYELPAPGGVIRLEEDHPDLRYDDYPFRTMPTTWSSESTLSDSSGQYNARTGTAGSTLSLEFEGTWVGVGFRSASWSGVAEIFIDGVSRGTVNTAGFTGGIMSVYYDDLLTGSHVISVTAVSGTVMPDFIDIWDGQLLAEGWYNATLDDYSGRFHYSNRGWWGQYENPYAYEGDLVRQNLINANPNIWLTFVGSDLTLLTRNGNDALLDITIDGEHYGEYNLTAEYSNQPYALHLPDLGDGPHVVQIHTRNWGSIDAFEVNPDDFYAYTPQITWHDNTAKESLEGASGTGFLTTIAIGDLNGDSSVELVAPGKNGRLYVYRGDGQDTGDGAPILWTSDLVGPAAEPALADLTGDGMAEIVVSGRHGTFAFRHDGVLLWENPKIVSYFPDEDLGWGGPTVANLDGDPEPEIVIAASDDALYVLDHTGAVEWSEPIGIWPTVPMVADITGDGRLNIVVAQQWELRVYDYLNGGGELAWTYVQTDTTNYARPGVFGAPAVADLTGDGRPEIIINWGHIVEALRHDGTSLWRYHTNNTGLYRPSTITVADVTGDGEANIITASAISAGFQVFDHLMMVLNADGTLVWEQRVADNSASASGVAAQDLTGNGVWEILWNGATDGFLIIRGSDGKRLFNEPVTGSGTIVEFPTMGDVDGDGVADVVVAGREGIFVISHVGRWADSRPLWNQHNYHITNINDDWSIPQVQPDSWKLHNTYRTQTPERSLAPVYYVEVSHTVGLSGVTVLTKTFSTPPTGTPPQYGWETQLASYAPVFTVTFASELGSMQPGETRQINQGTDISYRLSSGWNTLTLPPLYVTAARMLEIVPEEGLVSVGSTRVYTLTLHNFGTEDDVATLDVFGLPDDWLAYPTAVNVPAQASTDVLLSVTAPLQTQPGEMLFAVTAASASGAEETTTAALTLINALELELDPAAQTAPTGAAAVYTLTLTNNDSAAHTYELAASGPAEIALADTARVPAETSISLPITVTSTSHGPHPFTITAIGSGGGGSGSVDGTLTALGRYAVALALDPETDKAGPGTPASFVLKVTNAGDRADSYDLMVDAPPGWQVALAANGAPLNAVSLPPHIFNTADVHLQVTPDAGTAPGTYTFEVTAVSQARPSASTTLTGTVEVGPSGVHVTISPAQTTLTPVQEGVWQLTVTNVGAAADTYDLAATGIVALAASFTNNSVTLNPGQSQTVQMTTAAMPFVLTGTYRFQVVATSQTDGDISNAAAAEVAFSPYGDVEIAWLPTSQTLSGTLSTHYGLVISNTGTLLTTYQVDLDLPGLSGELAINPITVPPRSSAIVPLTVRGTQAGVYTLTATAQGSTAADSASATLTIVGVEEPGPDPKPDPDPEPEENPSFVLYLPLVQR